MDGFAAEPTKLLHLSFLTCLFRMEGEAAASADDPVSSDPYPDGSLESDLWLAGWTACSARKRMNDPTLPLERTQPEHRRAAPPAASRLLLPQLARRR